MKFLLVGVGLILRRAPQRGRRLPIHERGMLSRPRRAVDIAWTILTPVLRIIHRAINSQLIKRADIKRNEAATGAITLIRRFGSAANLNTHLHALVLDGVYPIAAEGPVFIEAADPRPAQLQTLLHKIIRKIMRLLTRMGYLIDEDGIVYLV